MSNFLGSSGLLPEVTTTVQLAKPANAPSAHPAAAGQFHWGFAFAGSRPGDLILKVNGWNFATAAPTSVFCQARQSDNIDHGWSDQFAVQVIETGRDFVRIRIHRIDNGGGGWGQNLRIDMLIIE